MDGGIEVLQKAVALLGYISRESGPLGVSELSRAMDLPKSTVHRILKTLNEDNVVLKTASGHYKVGPTALLWSSGYKFSSGIVDLARPWLEQLRDEIQETIHLSVYENGVAQYVECLDSLQTVVLRWSRLGTSLPLYCTAAGRAILSSLSPAELEAYLEKNDLVPRTPLTETNPQKLKEMLARFRIQGFAEENQENEANIRCVGAAIRDREERPVAAISLTAPSFRFGDQDAVKCGALLASAAQEISARL